MMSMQKAHPSYAMTGAMCTAAAAVVPGSIVEQVLRKEADTQYLRIGHAGGTLEWWRGLQRRKWQNISDRRHIWVPHGKSFTGWRGVSQNLTGEKDVPAP